MMSRESKKTLYICYLGLREPLVQTQVLPYLRQLGQNGIKIFFLTFEPNAREKWTPSQIEEARTKLAAENIEWHFLPYHKRPSAPATLYDIVNGVRFARSLMRKENIEILHARSHIPLAIGLIVKRLTGCRLVFDIRGFMAEEYVDSEIWSENSLPFKAIKKIERGGLRQAEQIVVLTEKMRQYLVGNNLRQSETIEVIPCCVDFSRISSNGNSKSKRFELIYAGSVTGLYMLEEMGRFFKILQSRKPDAFFRVLTASAPENVSRVFDFLKISASDYEVRKAVPEEVLNYMKRAHLAVSFRKATFSQIAASPTKIPEYLAAGLPVISNSGIGDTDELLEKNKVGVVIRDFSDAELKRAADKIIELLSNEKLAQRCVRAALDNFDLRTIGKNGYLNVYKNL